MLINGIDLSSLGVQLYDRILSSNMVDTTSDWLEGDIQPTFVRQQDKFKDITLKFLVTEKNETDAFLVMSRLTAMLRKAEIVFDDINLLFSVTTEGKTTQNRLKNGNFILTVKLKSDYAKGATEVYTTDSVATDYFKLKILYYQDGNNLLATNEKIIKASDFYAGISFEQLGINVDAYKPIYYKPGQVTNYTGHMLTYEELKSVGTLIINYAPIVYTKDVEYFIRTDEGTLESVQTVSITFTKKKVDDARNIGDLIDLKTGKPNGYRAVTNFYGDLTFDSFINTTLLQVYYEKIQNEESKNITITYEQETSDNQFVVFQSSTIVIKQSDIVLNSTLADFININGYKPKKYYSDGYLSDADSTAIITYGDLKDSYNVRYPLTENSVFVEYYYGEYPNWNRITTITYKFKYNTAYENSTDIITDIGIDINKYHSATYDDGRIYNANLSTFDDVVNVGVIQVYYKAKDYTLAVKYVDDTGKELKTINVTINETMFLNDPSLADIVDVNAARADGFIFDESKSYSGAITLGSLLANSPITIAYKPVETIKTKSIVIRYKQEMASTFSTINTSIITIEEAQVGGGVTLPDLFDLNAYRPDYYDEGLLDGVSASSRFTFDELQGEYSVLYMASTYTTQVRYYTDEVANENWIGSNQLRYRVLDFTTGTTLTDLGLDINAFKPSYCGNGEIQYTGPVNFSALRNLDAINIVYTAQSEPVDPSGIDYPHRILFLQHNDMGNYEKDYPTWTLNHAYINTGVTCDDMSKLTVLVNTYRVFDTEPLYNVNVGDAYLFGSVTEDGAYYIKYVNNTKFKDEKQLTGVNTFNVSAGLGTPELVVEESASEGFSANTGISSSTRDGYSYATLTYTQLVQSNSAKMTVPLYLFACDQNGFYRGGIAGVGIKSCKIYYDNNLIRDYVPVQFYDKIGDKIAPSNCLYDKVTQTFFEDATGKKSFNIMDDPDVKDTNPEHNIGCCYVNYYQGETLFQSSTIYFRESDFVNGNEWKPYDKLFVDYYQPEYYGPGKIVNLTDLGDVTFNSVKNFIFNVRYEIVGYHVTVKYWKDNKDDQANLIASEDVELKETDFLSVPTFGQVIDIQKHKPAGYKPNYSYNDKTGRVNLRRLLAAAPFDIIYTKVENPKTYTIKVKYYKEQYYLAEEKEEFFTSKYAYIGEKDVTIDETEFADGVYVDKFIDLDDMYPYSGVIDPDDEQKKKQIPFYTVGEPYGWYLKDEMLTKAEDIKDSYLVVYKAAEVPIEIRYYTDDVDENNLIATDVWNIKISNWEQDSSFQIVDEIPNSYTDKYKPVICWGGKLQNPDTTYTFKSLVEQGHLDFIYETKEEPHDPDNQDFPSKVLWFNLVEANDKGAIADSKDSTYTEAQKTFAGKDWSYLDISATQGNDIQYEPINTKTPYINLGYTPKEIGRLKVQTKAYAANAGFNSGLSYWSVGGNDFSAFFGYVCAPDVTLIKAIENGDTKSHDEAVKNLNQFYEEEDANGEFSLTGHTCYGSIGAYTAPTFLYFDGHLRFINRDGSVPGENLNAPMASDITAKLESVRELKGLYQKGKTNILNVDLEKRKIYNRYGLDDSIGYGVYGPYSPSKVQYYGSVDKEQRRSPWRTIKPGYITKDFPVVIGNPITMTLDAYHDYVEQYDYANMSHPEFYNLSNSDTDIWEYRGKPKGPLSLFIATNPNTGLINWKPCSVAAHMAIGSASSPLYLQRLVVGQNPYSQDFNATYTFIQQVITGMSDDGTPIYENKKMTKSYLGASWIFDSYPVPTKVAIWGLKIWDRDRLVRDLIPVAKGDKIYNFTAPANGLFDKITEIFFTNDNDGGTYTYVSGEHGKNFTVKKETITADQVEPLNVIDDFTEWGKITVNYYDENNKFLNNQYVTIPLHINENDTSCAETLHYNDFNPDTDLYHDGMIDVDGELKDINKWVDEKYNLKTPITPNGRRLVDYKYGEDGTEPTDKFLKDIYNAGSVNIYYKLKTFTKTVVYYRGNIRVGSKDIFYNINDIKNAKTLTDLGIDTSLYQSDDYKPGRIVFNENIIANDDIKKFIDAPSPIVIYDEWTKEEKPNLLYVNWYRGGAYDEDIIKHNTEDANYFDCDLTGKVMNPNGVIKYENHYHTALYEDETQDYFIAYQVDVIPRYVDIHKGPGRAYGTLATITDQGRYTVIQERRGWGRLKEYPKGWILLSYTKPAVGPGQHPSYEENKVVVTIPWATQLSISKMTIDRLWGYTPEYACWIKLDEISLDQTGKLYNGLDSQVIHLDEIKDWTAIKSIEDLGFSINQYQLRYHNPATYNYSGELTQAALSDVHNIDIVYPETIYAYNCYYYKDVVDDSTKLGTISFSCSLSDWNPDWPTFLSTSYKYETISTNGSATIAGDTSQPAYYMTEETTASAAHKETISIIAGTAITITGNKFVSSEDNKIYYPIFYNDKKCWIAEESLKDITEYKETEDYTKPINPTLYRDTQMRLGWDFFGVERNKYKPDNSYQDGLFLWNPRTWDTVKNEFTFEELITTGIQQILYIPQMTANYMAYFDGTKGDQGLSIPLDIDKYTFVPELDQSKAIWDVEIKSGYTTDLRGSLKNAPDFYFDKNWIKRSVRAPRLFDNRNNENYYQISNVSNKRNATLVYSIGNPLTQYQSPYNVEAYAQGINSGYIEDSLSRSSYLPIDKKDVEITNSLNTNQSWMDMYRFYEDAFKNYSSANRNVTFSVHSPNGIKDPQDLHDGTFEDVQFYNKNNGYTTDLGDFSTSADSISVKAAQRITYHSSNVGWVSEKNIIYKNIALWYIKVWKNYLLTHYWIPVPKGYRLPDGSQIQYNTMYDVISHTVASVCKNEDWRDETLKYSGPDIYYDNKELVDANKVDYFAGWNNYTISDVNYVVQTSAEIQGYEAPDVLSIATNKYETGLVIPVNGETSDSEHNISGKWYRAYDGTWFQADNTTILATDKYSISAVDLDLAIKAENSSNARNTVTNCVLNLIPENDSKEYTKQTCSTETVQHYTAKCGDYFFGNFGWMPQKATELNTTAINKNYSISVKLLPVYSHPIKNDAYFIKNLQEGDRITATAQLVRDGFWQKIDSGWIDTENSVSEIN